MQKSIIKEVKEKRPSHLTRKQLEAKSYNELVAHGRGLAKVGYEIHSLYMMTKFLKRALVMEILAAQDKVEKHTKAEGKEGKTSRGVSYVFTGDKSDWDTETKQFLSLRYEQPYIPTGKKAKKREQIINEIVDSEKVYLRGLTILVKEFNVDFVNKFANLLLEFHGVFEVDLRNSSNIAEVFDKNADYLKMGNPYVEGYTEMMQKLAELRGKKKFQKKLSELKQKGFADISSYLITPVQRVPRYLLLLTDLLKHTPAKHPQYEVLTRALDKVRSVAYVLNEAGRRIEEMNILYQLELEINGQTAPIVQSGRRFIEKGWFKERANGEEEKAQCLFVFSDQMLLTKKSTAGMFDCYQEIKHSFISQVVPMSNLQVVDEKEGTATGNFVYGLQIRMIDHSSVFLFFNQPQVRDKFVELLEKLRVVNCVRVKMTIQRDGRVMMTSKKATEEELRYSSLGKHKEARLIGINPAYAETQSKSDDDLFANLPLVGSVVERQATLTTLNPLLIGSPKSQLKNINSKKDSSIAFRDINSEDEKRSQKDSNPMKRGPSEDQSLTDNNSGLSTLIRDEFY